MTYVFSDFYQIIVAPSCKVQGGEKRPLGRPSCRFEDNIKMDLQEVC